jgi:spoIIIJ-associated protein
MSSLEFEGKNIDKAVKNACDELNLAADEISYQILSRGSSGIFGLAGAKKARIKVALPQKTPKIGADAVIEKPDAPVFEEKAQRETASSDDAHFDGPQRHSFEEHPLDLSRAVLQRIVDAITSDATISAEEKKDRPSKPFNPSWIKLSINIITTMTGSEYRWMLKAIRQPENRI